MTRGVKEEKEKKKEDTTTVVGDLTVAFEENLFFSFFIFTSTNSRKPLLQSRAYAAPVAIPSSESLNFRWKVGALVARIAIA